MDWPSTLSEKISQPQAMLAHYLQLDLHPRIRWVSSPTEA